ncbi:MAG: hypothetical protein DRQ55_11595 [Planctomycetota bacterium]|nr:MAG: hypothetical protein DRQ55_11595 [Planctomycetota bacterium]
MRLGALALALLAPLLMTACGGGGSSGGGGGGGGGGTAANSVTFLGFSFIGSGGVETTTPPVEDLSAFPPSVGAPLNLTVAFHFDGVPAGPFTQASLPVYTTKEDITPAAGLPPGVNTVPAKGTYHLVVQEPPPGADAEGSYRVDFRPFVPTEPLQVNLSAPANAVPGLLPSTTYTAEVSTKPESKLTNLKGGGGEVAFGTTTNPAAYYPSDSGAAGAPQVLLSVPEDGALDFFPNTFALRALDSTEDTFPPGPSDFVLSYDRPVLPVSENLQGRDLDGDGAVDSVFSLWARATSLLVGHTVPEDILFSGHGPFPALSTLAPGMGSSSTGDDILLFGGDGVILPESDAMPSVPTALASGRDAGLLFLVYARDGETDLFTMGDNFLGQALPGVAAIAVEEPGGPPAVLDSGLDDLVGLVQLLDGRLVGFDHGLHRIVELLPEFTRKPATPQGNQPGPPVLTDLVTAADEAGSDLFLGEEWPVGVEVLDLAQAPSGDLLALTRSVPGSLPSLVTVTSIDPDVDGQFEDGEGAMGDELFMLSHEYVAIEFLAERELAALNRTLDSIDRVSLDSGFLEVYVPDVASFGVASPAPDGLSPAYTLAFGRMELDLDVALLSNTEAGAVVRLSPVGVLPIGAELTLMQRNTFTSLAGFSEVNSDPAKPKTTLGAVEVLELETASPLAGTDVDVDDVYSEEFIDQVFRDPQPVSTSPLAEWAEVQQGSSLGSDSLRATAAVSETAMLGDFSPTKMDGFVPADAWVRTVPSWSGGQEPEKHPEFVLDMARANYRVVLLDTDTQNFPLSGGFTPGVNQPVTVFGGHFVFRDFIIPEGVHVIVRGSNPLRITATGRVEINGMLDVRGTDGLSDDTFDSGFLAVPGGVPGPGGGRGGDSHPTRFDPSGSGGIDQFVTPETGEHGWGPTLDAAGQVKIQQIGGRGGLCTVGYHPDPLGYPSVGLQASGNGNVPNNERHRPPGGGGGSFYQRGAPSHEGTGSYLVQSESTWFPFTKCPTNDKQNDALYGNDENIAAGVPQAHRLQCVYMLGDLDDPVRKQPGAQPGQLVFTDSDPENDYVGEGGEIGVLIGGQGGGGGGSRIDSIDHALWSSRTDVPANNLGLPLVVPVAPPYYPILNAGSVFFSPTLFDGKGGAGGGGGGSAQIRSFGDIVIGKTGHIDARGGHGGGGEVVQNSNVGGGGGGGSGGAILLQAAGTITVDANIGHQDSSYTDASNLEGASLEVSGGFGRESQTDTPTQNFVFQRYTYDFTRSDGGQGGFGLIQLQAGSGAGAVHISDGAFLFAKVRTVQKQGTWTGDSGNKQAEHPDWPGGGPKKLRYIEMLHYRYYKHDVEKDYYQVLNGSFPPIIPSLDGDNGPYPGNTWPLGTAKTWGDTLTVANDYSQGVRVVADPTPDQMMESYFGYDDQLEEIEDEDGVPGVLFDASDEIPLSIYLVEPDGTPFLAQAEGAEQAFEPTNIIDRLPVVPLHRTPPPIGTRSVGRSKWLDFSGAMLRPRSGSGRTPPFFEAFHGTYNDGVGAVPSGFEGLVGVGAPVDLTTPAHYVLSAGFSDPGLFGGGNVGSGSPPNPPFNDIKVDAPDEGVARDDVITDNAVVSVRFQGAYPVRPGSHVPDNSSLTLWVTDLTVLDGYPLVRYQVEFDLGVDTEEFPFGVDALRPAVDYLRVRAGY